MSHSAPVYAFSRCSTTVRVALEMSAILTSMGMIVPVSEEEYLGTAYEPDCEFEDGVLIERNLGEQDHSWLQAALAAYFFQRRRLWSIEVYTEQRHRIRKGKYMIPDVCVISQPEPDEKVFSQPPLI